MNNQVEPFLLSIGTAVPENCISQEQLYRFYETYFKPDRIQRLKLKRIMQNSGIKSRHSVIKDFASDDHVLFDNGRSRPPIGNRMKVYKQHALNLAINAIDDCFEKSPGNIKDISHIITFSCTGMYAPGIDMEVIEHYNLSLDIERTCINFMGCYAAFNALKNAYHILRSQPEAKVLLVGVELCSIHYTDSIDDEQLVANSIFADGAAAVVLSSNPDKSGTNLQLKNFYSEFESTGKKEMTWDIGDSAFNLKLGSYVPDMINKGIEKLTNKLISRSQLNSGDIHYYAIHPGGIKILEACEKALSITRDDNRQAYEVLNKYGNMSSVTILFVLKNMMRAFSQNDHNKNILGCAFGPGLTMESMILKIHSL